MLHYQTENGGEKMFSIPSMTQKHNVKPSERKGFSQTPQRTIIEKKPL